ncbi:hypothetical protein EUX98_g1597 [Antrodiella citrinella]|uniref:Uncharacterized protein n=1 Tax=Antrodiella citrinella TaxID=2447956 RepID=A0A4S4N125_9APHY|nr:hypothetical protein EUX98_g1597 [Antrodiella citrinella]
MTKPVAPPLDDDVDARLAPPTGLTDDDNTSDALSIFPFPFPFPSTLAAKSDLEPSTDVDPVPVPDWDTPTIDRRL